MTPHDAVALIQRALVSVALLAAPAPSAAQPRFVNAQVTQRTVTASLSETVRSIASIAVAPMWVAWEAPSVPRRHGDTWCWDNGALVQSNRLEPADTVLVFLRFENRRLERVRLFHDGCAIDAGDRPVTWLQGVNAADSVTLLSAIAGGESPVAARSDTRVYKGAMAALALHRDPEAVRPLLRFARQAPDPRLRGEALFWLAQRAGREATQAITRAIEEDPETQVKKRAVFALSQLPPDEGVPKLIDVARTNPNPAVRKQAMFWLGQSKDARALAFFEEILLR